MHDLVQRQHDLAAALDSKVLWLVDDKQLVISKQDAAPKIVAQS